MQNINDIITCLDVYLIWNHVYYWQRNSTWTSWYPVPMHNTFLTICSRFILQIEKLIHRSTKKWQQKWQPTKFDRQFDFIDSSDYVK